MLLQPASSSHTAITEDDIFVLVKTGEVFHETRGAFACFALFMRKDFEVDLRHLAKFVFHRIYIKISLSLISLIRALIVCINQVCYLCNRLCNKKKHYNEGRCIPN